MAVVTALQNLRADGDIVTESGVQKMSVTDENQADLLSGILREMVKMNFHMTILTDVVINDVEVE